MEPHTNTPTPVLIAVRVMWCALAVGLCNAVFQTIHSANRPSWPVLVVVLLVLVAYRSIFAWLTIQIGRGRHWARVTLLVLFVVALMGWIPGVRAHAQESIVGTLISGLVGLGQLTAIVLIFTPSANRWFSRQRRSPNGLA
jgi:hypothetical protein